MPTTTNRRPRSRATVFLTVASLVSLTILFIGIALPASLTVPHLAWRLFEDQRQLPPLTTVTAGTPIGVKVDLPFPAHVYVASWSTLQGTIALFPSKRLATDLENPLPAGTHWLPGAFDGKPMTWPTHAVVGPIYYLAVASRERLEALEETLQRVKQMGQMTRLGAGFTDRTMYVFPESGAQVEPRDKPVTAELDAARNAFPDLESLVSDGVLRELADRPGVFVRPFVLQGH